MKNKKSTKRALLLSALSLLLCMAMLVGSTFAWFTDSVTSGRNTIVSGQLDVELEYATLTNGVWSAYAPVTESTKVFSETALYEPGYTEVVKFRVTNAGTLALKYNLDAKVYHETAGTNVYNESFNLSEYLYTGTLAAADYTREAAVAAATTKLADGFNLKAATQLLPGVSEEIVLVLTMPTAVGNEANHIDGFQPKIELGISLIATQATYEADDFDNLYDANAQLPVNQAVTAPVAAGAADTVVSFEAPGSKLTSFTAEVPAAALAANATEVVLTVQEQTTVASGITVSADQTATSYEIEIEGIAAGNTTPISVSMNIGTGLTNVKLYHEDELIPSTYNPATGILTFETADFSPFTVVCDAQLDYAVVSTFAELQAALKAGGTVVLGDNIAATAPVTVPAGAEVVLDLNGKVLSYDTTVQNEALIYNKGWLAINDSVGGGEIFYDIADVVADSSHGKGNYTIDNAGYLEVNGGKINIAQLSSHAKYPINNNSTTGDAIVVINGGHLYNYNTSAIRQFCNSTTYKNSVTVNGGLLEGYCVVWMQNPGSKTVNGSLTVTGGEFKTTAKAYVNGTATVEEVASEIYATVEGGAWDADSFVSITGGIFNENVVFEEGPASITIGDGATFNGNVVPQP